MNFLDYFNNRVKVYLKLSLLSFLVLTTFITVGLVGQRQNIENQAATASGPVTVSLVPSKSAYEVGEIVTVTLIFQTGDTSMSAYTFRIQTPYSASDPEIELVDPSGNPIGLSSPPFYPNINLPGFSDDWYFPTNKFYVETGFLKIDIGGAYTYFTGFKTAQNMVMGRFYFRIKKIPSSGSINLSFDDTMSKVIAKNSYTDILSPPASSSVRISRVNTFSRVNCGGKKYVDSQEKIWFEDRFYSSGMFGYIGGRSYQTTKTISGTPDPKLYKTERLGMSSYKFDVLNGNYQVLLKFAEIYPGCQSVKCRIFDVSIEGVKVLENLDIFSQVGGYKALDFIFTTVVLDNQLTIQFAPNKNKPQVNAIEIIKL